jgi:hypothetical protein
MAVPDKIVLRYSLASEYENKFERSAKNGHGVEATRSRAPKPRSFGVPARELSAASPLVLKGLLYNDFRTHPFCVKWSRFFMYFFGSIKINANNMRPELSIGTPSCSVGLKRG